MRHASNATIAGLGPLRAAGRFGSISDLIFDAACAIAEVHRRRALVVHKPFLFLSAHADAAAHIEVTGSAAPIAANPLMAFESLEVQKLGAGEGNRTLVISLEGFCSTIELHPRNSRPNLLMRDQNTMSFAPERQTRIEGTQSARTRLSPVTRSANLMATSGRTRHRVA
jgi:hypothetical protein